MQYANILFYFYNVVYNKGMIFFYFYFPDIYLFVFNFSLSKLLLHQRAYLRGISPFPRATTYDDYCCVRNKAGTSLNERGNYYSRRFQSIAILKSSFITGGIVSSNIVKNFVIGYNVKFGSQHFYHSFKDHDSDIFYGDEGLYTDDYLKYRIKRKKSSTELEASVANPILETAYCILQVVNAQSEADPKVQRINEIFSLARRFETTFKTLTTDQAAIIDALLQLNMPLYKGVISLHLERANQYYVEFSEFLKNSEIDNNTSAQLIIPLFKVAPTFEKTLHESLAVIIADFIKSLLTKRTSLEKRIVTRFEKIVAERKQRDFRTKLPVVKPPEFLAYATAIEQTRHFPITKSGSMIKYKLVHRYYKDPLAHIEYMHDCLYDTLFHNIFELKNDFFKYNDKLLTEDFISVENKVDEIIDIESVALLKDLASINASVYEHIAITLNKFKFNLYSAQNNQIKYCIDNILLKPPELTPAQKAAQKIRDEQEIAFKRLVKEREERLKEERSRPYTQKELDAIQNFEKVLEEFYRSLPKRY